MNALMGLSHQIYYEKLKNFEVKHNIFTKIKTVRRSSFYEMKI